MVEINHMIHGQARGLDHALYILERLANLIRKVRWRATILAARPLAGNIHIISRVDCGRTEAISRSRHLLRSDGSQLGVDSGVEEKQRCHQQEQCPHAALPLRAEPRIVRSLCPTIISSPG